MFLCRKKGPAPHFDFLLSSGPTPSQAGPVGVGRRPRRLRPPRGLPGMLTARDFCFYKHRGKRANRTCNSLLLTEEPPKFESVLATFHNTAVSSRFR